MTKLPKLPADYKKFLKTHDGQPYALERLAAGLAIGDNNGDVVFLDPADAHSVWLFHQDGADVERLADTFQEWLDRAEPDELGDDDEDEDAEED